MRRNIVLMFWFLLPSCVSTSKSFIKGLTSLVFTVSVALDIIECWVLPACLKNKKTCITNEFILFQRVVVVAGVVVRSGSRCLAARLVSLFFLQQQTVIHNSHTSLSFWLRSRTQPLNCVGCSVHYWVSCAIIKGDFFEIVEIPSQDTFASLWGARLTWWFVCPRHFQPLVGVLFSRKVYRQGVIL